MIKHDHENESSQTILTKNKFKSHFSDHISHFETRRKTRYQYTFAAIRFNIHYNKQNFIKRSSLIYICRNNDSFIDLSNRAKKEKCCEKKLIIVMFSKKIKIKFFKIKRLFLFIIVCYFKNLSTIQSFREVKKRNRLTLKKFSLYLSKRYRCSLKNLEFDFDYNFLSFKL